MQPTIEPRGVYYLYTPLFVASDSDAWNFYAVDDGDTSTEWLLPAECLLVDVSM